jgi:hypothetical protein
MLSTHLADKVFEAIAVGHVHALADWLMALGCTNRHTEGEQETITGLTGVRVGLVMTDPNTLAVQVGFVLAGMFWPMTYPQLQKVVNKRWKEIIKKPKIPELILDQP